MSDPEETRPMPGVYRYTGIDQYLYRMTVDEVMLDGQLTLGETLRNGRNECVLGDQANAPRSDHRFLIENGGWMLQLILALHLMPEEHLLRALTQDAVAEVRRIALAALRAGIDTIAMSEDEGAPQAFKRLGWRLPEKAPTAETPPFEAP